MSSEKIYKPKTTLLDKFIKHSSSKGLAKRAYNAMARYYSIHKGHDTEEEWTEDLKTESLEVLINIPDIGRKFAVVIVNVVADVIGEK